MTHYDPKDHTLLERVEALEESVLETSCTLKSFRGDIQAILNSTRMADSERLLLESSCAGWMDRLTKRMDEKQAWAKSFIQQMDDLTKRLNTTDNDVAITIRSMADLSERIDEVEDRLKRHTHSKAPL